MLGTRLSDSQLAEREFASALQSGTEFISATTPLILGIEFD